MITRIRHLALALALCLFAWPAFAAPSYGSITDWTNGTGVCPAGGAITVTANTARQFFYVQNRDTTPVTILYSATYANGLGTGTTTVVVAPASSAGGQGGSEERETEVFMPARQQVIVNCTAGKQLTVMTSSGG